ncbi:hypothetical protein IE53DRAFT_364056 [Violaceomyces palustris]|uniref:Uncharacterized protein n=1 Tax=Violaceomyces palustris TaxID=1673888 RepID=A0ACD0NQY1_9BASI|nr:hypothetical protein IE53DRAFT_364056 [Violaceomyces palustris]
MTLETLAFSALRWTDNFKRQLPEPIGQHVQRIPSEYLVLVPISLLTLLLLLSLARPSSRTERPHLESSSGSTKPARRPQHSAKPTKVLLVGSQDTGKTSLFTKLVYDTVPNTLPSQRESQANFKLVGSGSEARKIESQDEPLESVSLPAGGDRTFHLVDLPGHPRLRPKVEERLNQADVDAIIICVDASTATKSGATTTGLIGKSQKEGDGLTESADLVHSTLISLAKLSYKFNTSGSSSSSRFTPPSVMVAFSRSDLSPLLSSSSTTTATTITSTEEKRRNQLLSRCKTSLESELARRRSGMGFGKKTASVKIGSISKVEAGSSDSNSSGSGFGGLIASLKKLLRLGSGSSGGNGRRGDEDEDEEQDEDREAIDYIDWETSQRLNNLSATSSSSKLSNNLGAGAGGNNANHQASFSLEKLDDQVVWGGKVDFALCSVGKERGWSLESSHQDGSTESSRDGLQDIKVWLKQV